MHRLIRPLVACLGLATLALAMPAAQAQPMSGEELIRALQDGGHVIVMNQAPSELRAPGRGGRGGFGGGRGGRGGGPAADPVPMLTTDSENMLIGTRHAIWWFRIPIAAVYTSPAPVAVQHAGEVPFAAIAQVAGLAESSSDSGWLEAKLGEPPLAGENAIVVTHGANIEAALDVDNVAEGETLIVSPGESPTVIGRLGMRDWSVLAIELEP